MAATNALIAAGLGLIPWRDDLLLVHDARPHHLGSPGVRLQVPGKDIRDPNFAVIRGELFL